MHIFLALVRKKCSALEHMMLLGGKMIPGELGLLSPQRSSLLYLWKEKYFWGNLPEWSEYALQAAFFQHRHAAMWAVINSVSLVVQDCPEKKIKSRGPDASLEDLNDLPGLLPWPLWVTPISCTLAPQQWMRLLSSQAWERQEANGARTISTVFFGYWAPVNPNSDW